jgi:uncharacterized membrane protein
MMRNVGHSRKHRAFYSGGVNVSDIILAEPTRLWLAAGFGVAALAAGLVAGRRHVYWARFSAGVIRLLALCLVGYVLASPGLEVVNVSRVELIEEEWSLDLTPGARVGDRKDRNISSRDVWFVESPYAFAARIRNALASRKLPYPAYVYGPRAEALYARDLVRAIGHPCEAIIMEDARGDAWALGEIQAPSTMQPGEALDAALDVFGPELPAGASVELSVDGRKFGKIAGGQLPNLSLPTGRHVLTIELLDATGKVIQRVGHVVRVGAQPRLLAVGLDAAAFAQLERLAPNFTRKAIEPRELTSALLRETEVVVMPVVTGVRITSAQSRELAQFVANGGGVYVTGDGAAQTNRLYLDIEFRKLLPVQLLDQKQDPPPNNPIKEEKGESDVAAVSMVFVIDRSNSMNAVIKGGVTRWHVAVESIKKALSKLDPWDRAGVLSFTLAQTWQTRPQVIAPFDREIIAKKLLRLRTDDNYDSSGYNTDIYKAVEEGLAVLEQERSAVKVLVVLTDGGDRDNDDGSVRDHHKLAEYAMSKSMNIYALGIGSQFSGGDHYAEAAKKVIKGLATKEEFAFIAPDEDAAVTAQVVFTRAVEFAYKAYDDKMKEREREKERRPIEPKDPKVDVLEGKFPLALTPVGRQLFGMRELPEPAPRLLKYARCQLRGESALALSFSPTESGASPVALALSSFGLGRVGFWASGSDAQWLGDVAKWEEYPRLVAQTLRWLLPREDPQPRLVGGATTEGIGLIDPIEEARYTLRTQGRELELTLRDGVLHAKQGELPEGDGEIVERLGAQERVIGDVFLATVPATVSRQTPLDNAPPQPVWKEEAAKITTRHEPAHEMAALCLIAMLALMPIERLIRRRN